MDLEMMHPADRIVTIMNRLYNYGMTTTSGGNLSVCDPDGTVWISPSGIDKGSLRREDIMQIKPDGTIIGPHKPSSEYPFHLAIYAARPDLKAVLHAHPPALVAFSLIREIPDTTLIPDAKLICGDIRMAEYALPGSKLLGEKIAKEFANGINTVMLENHGVVIGSDDLFKAFMTFETLDYCARLEINARSLGKVPHGLSDKHMAMYKLKIHPEMDEFVPRTHSSEELDARAEMCKLIHRAYDNQLFMSSQGTFSKRLSDGSFIITPYDMDRKYLEPADLVRIEDNRKEHGKNPSRSVNMHKAIYEKHPEIQSIICAHPPHIMAFAITDAEFDARLIPESYIMLNNVRKFPFGSTFMQTDLLSDEISLKNPVCIIENDCVIVGGTSLINAFDRLEVMEYSAKSVIDTTALHKPVVKISPEEVKDIEVAFNL